MTRVDDYNWLRNRKNPRVTAYLEAENAYTRAMTAHTQPLEDRLFAELRSRVPDTDVSAPVRKDGHFYYSKFETGRQYAVHCRRVGSMTAPETILLDENALATHHEYYDVGGLECSPDHSLLAYAVDTDGNER